jgi:hypothetical protein
MVSSGLYLAATTPERRAKLLVDANLFKNNKKVVKGAGTVLISALAILSVSRGIAKTSAIAGVILIAGATFMALKTSLFDARIPRISSDEVIAYIHLKRGVILGLRDAVGQVEGDLKIYFDTLMNGNMCIDARLRGKDFIYEKQVSEMLPFLQMHLTIPDTLVSNESRIKLLKEMISYLE